MRRHRRGFLAVGLALLGACVVVVVPGTPVAAVTNPQIEDSCGLDVTLALDASGSIQSSHAVGESVTPDVATPTTSTNAST